MVMVGSRLMLSLLLGLFKPLAALRTGRETQYLPSIGSQVGAVGGPIPCKVCFVSGKT